MTSESADHAKTVELGRVVAPVAKVIGGVIGLIIAVAATVSGYYSMVGRIDRLDERMAQQGRTLESLANSINLLASEALTATDLRAFCLQSQIANQRIGFVCHFTGVETPKPIARRPVLKPATPNGGTAWFNTK